jgi:hypothetical protein
MVVIRTCLHTQVSALIEADTRSIRARVITLLSCFYHSPSNFTQLIPVRMDALQDPLRWSATCTPHCGQYRQSDRLPENNRIDCCGTVDLTAAMLLNRLQVHTYPKLYFGHFDTRCECPMTVGSSVPWQSGQGLPCSWFDCGISFQ